MKKLKQNGFSLVEVLVSIFVLALGVIGAAAMQLTALHYSQQSAFQSAATQLASDMADRMRVNDTQLKLDDGENRFVEVDYKSSDKEPEAPDKLCYATRCTGPELAKFDLYDWRKRVKAALPGGRAVICRDAMPWDSGAAALTWACSSGTGNSAPIVIKLGWQTKGKNPDGSTARSADKPLAPSLAIVVSPYSK
jgi:type IV pilus assembly protein PilV